MVTGKRTQVSCQLLLLQRVPGGELWQLLAPLLYCAILERKRWATTGFFDEWIRLSMYWVLERKALCLRSCCQGG